MNKIIGNEDIPLWNGLLSNKEITGSLSSMLREGR